MHVYLKHFPSDFLRDYGVTFGGFQVGSYFVGQYYQVLQQQPEFVHQFYSDASTMLRIDANTREAASGLLVMLFLNYCFYLLFATEYLESNREISSGQLE